MSCPDNSTIRFATGATTKLSVNSLEETLDLGLRGNSERGPSQQVKVYETVEEFMIDFKAGE